MEKSFDEARPKAVLNAAKDCRMKQLESDFDAWPVYAAAVQSKKELMSSLESLLTGSGRKILWKCDDVTSLMVCNAQDYFYDWGFTDCLNLIRLVLGGVPEESKG